MNCSVLRDKLEFLIHLKTSAAHWRPCPMTDAAYSLKPVLEECYAKAYEAGAKRFGRAVLEQWGRQ